MARGEWKDGVDADALGRRIAFCIGIYETNRGGSHPTPRESDLRTVAGIRASMATTDQATIPYALDAFRKYDTLRKVSVPPLTIAEIKAGNDCCTAVVKLLNEVKAAKSRGDSPTQFIATHAALIASAALSGADAQTMFQALDLKSRIDSLRTEVQAGRMTALQAANSIPEENRLELNIASLKSYISKDIWGENAAAWKRKGVQNLPGKIESRINAVAVANDGTSIANLVYAGRVKDALVQGYKNLKDLVIAVAATNNPGDSDYGNNVWDVYKGLYGESALTQPVQDQLVASAQSAFSRLREDPVRAAALLGSPGRRPSIARLLALSASQGRDVEIRLGPPSRKRGGSVKLHYS